MNILLNTSKVIYALLKTCSSNKIDVQDLKIGHYSVKILFINGGQTVKSFVKI